jgi:hypothetical protein
MMQRLLGFPEATEGWLRSLRKLQKSFRAQLPELP